MAAPTLAEANGLGPNTLEANAPQRGTPAQSRGVLIIYLALLNRPYMMRFYGQAFEKKD